jgi:hypothetical protein
MALELIPLCHAEFPTGEQINIGKASLGRRLVGVAQGSRWEGERLHANQKGPGGDWALVGPDRVLTIDARLTLETDDGALIYVQYGGRGDLNNAAGVFFYTTPQFETGDERYAWLNRIQAVGKGTLLDQTLSYDIYELR